MYPSVVCIGDSQTQLAWCGGGWLQQLAEHNVRKADIINRGFSGYNTRMLLQVLPDLLSSAEWSRAAVVTLMIGSNDASLEKHNPEQAVPLEEFGDNLLRIVSFILSQGVDKDKLVLVSPPPVLPQVWTQHLNSLPGPGGPHPNCKDNQLTLRFSEECKAVANKLNLIFVDLFSSMTEAAVSLPSLLSDGLHLGERGHKLLADLLHPLIEKRLIQHSAGLKGAPEWRDLDNCNVKHSYQKWKENLSAGIQME